MTTSFSQISSTLWVPMRLRGQIFRKVAVGSLWPSRAWMTPYLELWHFLLKSSPPPFSDLSAKIHLEIFESIELKFIYVNFLNILYSRI